MARHPVGNFEIQKYETEPKFDGAYSRNNSPKRKDGAYIINLEEYKSIGSHQAALYVNAKNETYFNIFGLNVFQKKFKNSQGIKMLQQIFIEHKHTVR